MAVCQQVDKLSTDRLMRNVASSLVRDFQTNLDDPLFCSDHLSDILEGDIAAVRRSSPALDDEMDIATYKATYQIQSINKRYRFRDDIYSDAELIDASIMKFREVQDRISAHDLTSVDEFTTRVLNTAKIYIAQCLGKYSDEEHRTLCRFGRKASVGIPSRMANEAARWELPISGSLEQIKWFDSEMSQVVSVQEYWAEQLGSDPNRSTYQETSSLALTLVPKTFKSLRAIMPNTTIGSYMSFGLGEMIRKRLQRKGYDIRTLQQRHRILASQGSVHTKYTTTDLSSASDTISVALVKELFPSDWYEVLSKSRIGTVQLPDSTSIESQTFCTMGIGYTFPLQTLVFLSLLKAVEATLYHRWNRRTISVYGDDMIYSSPMHTTVVRVFEQLGFCINVDKTFSTGHFRESCGGDYFHGVDVRPFQPRNGSVSVSPKAYEAMLYKCVNGLLARWNEHEIGRTLAYLTSEIESVAVKCKLVPGDFPDDAGIKCPTLQHWDFLQCAVVCSPVHNGHGVYRFQYLRLIAQETEEVRHVPFYWQRLRGYIAADHFDSGNCYPGDAPDCYTPVVDYLRFGVRELVSSLKVREVKPVVTIRSSISGRRLRRQTTFVTISHTGSYTRRSGRSCFEDRR